MRKIFIKVLTVCLIICSLIGALTACGEGNGHTHTYPETYTFDSEFHWFECECGEKKSTAQHAFIDGKCTCGYEQKAEHTHDYTITNFDEIKHWKECSCGDKKELTQHAFTDGKCVCGYQQKAEHTHDYTITNFDEIKHWKECSCGDKKESIQHAFTDGKCACGYEKEEEGGQTPSVPDTPTTPDTPTHTHNYAILKFDQNNHWKECSCGEKGTVSAHSGGTATCTKKAVCGYCGSEFGELKPHTYSREYSFDENRHWKEVTCGCDIEPTYENHGTGGNNCPTCEYPFKPTDGNIYDKSADGTYAEVIGYEGSAKKIKIAETYQGLPVKSIYNEAVEDTNITFVIISDSIESIGDNAFKYCGLTKVVIPDSVTSIGDNAFWGCRGLTNIVIPDSVTSIGEWAFAFCNNLVSIDIGNGVTSIGEHAFYDCYKLKYNEYDNCKYLGNNENKYAYLIAVSNEKMSAYTIHNDTRIICSYAFEGCTRLASIEIPYNVIGIAERAFSDCDNLTSVNFKNTSGWVVGLIKLSSADLANDETAVKFLTNTYLWYDWTRS